jgi:hypothetical protein
MAVDFAWAALPLIVVANELAFAAPNTKGLLPPVAVAAALAVPPSIAVEVAVAFAGPPPPTMLTLPPVA